MRIQLADALTARGQVIAVGTLLDVSDEEGARLVSHGHARVVTVPIIESPRAKVSEPTPEVAKKKRRS